LLEIAPVYKRQQESWDKVCPATRENSTIFAKLPHAAYQHILITILSQ